MDHLAKPNLEFVREISQRSVKTIDLVDVVAGGDGFGGARHHGIDPSTGRAIRDFRREHPNESTWSRTGDYRYHRVNAMPYIDGVFIPHAGKGPVQLDSDGHRFDDFLTLENLTFRLYLGRQFYPQRSRRTHQAMRRRLRIVGAWAVVDARESGNYV